MRRLPKRCGVLQRRTLGLLLALLALAAPGPSKASTGEIATQVRCEALSDEVRAEFEARAQVDLSLRAAGGGELEVTCSGLEAHLRWRPRSGGTFERAVPAVSSAKMLVDALLVTVADLASDAMNAKARDEHAGGEGVPEAEPKEKGDLRKDPLLGAKEGSKEQTPPSLAGASDRSSTSGESTGGSFALGTSLGGQVAFFDVRGTGLAGPELGILVGLPAGLVGSVAGSYPLGLGDGSTVSVRAPGVTALIAKSFGPQRAFELAAGGSVGSIIATPSDPCLPASDDNAYLAAVVRGRYGLKIDSLRFSWGPEVRFYAWNTEVKVDNRTVWRESIVSAGLTLDISARVYGALW